MIEEDKIKDITLEFELTFGSLSNWIENRGYVGTKQAILDFWLPKLKQEREKIIEELKVNKDFCPICGADLPPKK